MKFSNLFIWGHRGLPAQEKENQLSGIRAALKAGVGGVEIDVQTAQGGEVIVLHDETLDRTTNLKGFAKYTPYDEMRQEGVPELFDVIALLRTHREQTGKRVVLNIEIKHAEAFDRVANSIHHAIASHGFVPTDFLISSFIQPVLLRCRQQLKDIPRAVCVEGVPLHYLETVSTLDVDAVHINASFPDPIMIRDLVARGKRVHAYTVNDPKHVKRLQDLGVSGIFTDNAPAFL